MKNDQRPPVGDKDKRVFGVDLAKKGYLGVTAGIIKESHIDEKGRRVIDKYEITSVSVIQVYPRGNGKTLKFVEEYGNMIPGDTIAEKIANLRMARIQAERS